MKITKQAPEFQPINIKLESQQEIDLLREIVGDLGEDYYAMLEPDMIEPAKKLINMIYDGLG